MEVSEVSIDGELLRRAKKGDALAKLMVFDQVFGCECGDCGGDLCNKYPIPILNLFTNQEKEETLREYVERRGENSV